MLWTNFATVALPIGPTVPPGRCCLSCPLPLRERAQGYAHDLEWVRGLREDPSPIHHLAAGSCPLPQGGEGAITSTALAAPISSQARVRGGAVIALTNRSRRAAIWGRKQ